MFYNLGSGGDGTMNPNWALYPQRALVIGETDNTVVSPGATPLMPAEHMSSATYNIWRNINFGHERFPTNLGVREFLKRLYAGGGNIVADDLIGMVTLPRLAVLRGVMLQVNAANAGVVFNVVSMATGEVLLENIDASTTGVHYVDISGFVVAADSNDSLALQIVAWPELDTDQQDPCGVYGPCDDLTLCVTLNAFIWSPVSAEFCKEDPCFGVLRRSILAEGTIVADRVPVSVEDPIEADTDVQGFDPEASSLALGEDELIATVVDTNGDPIEGAGVVFVASDVPAGVTVTIDPASAVTDASGVATVSYTVTGEGEAGGTITAYLGSAAGPVIGTLPIV